MHGRSPIALGGKGEPDPSIQLPSKDKNSVCAKTGVKKAASPYCYVALHLPVFGSELLDTHGILTWSWTP